LKTNVGLVQDRIVLGQLEASRLALLRVLLHLVDLVLGNGIPAGLVLELQRVERLFFLLKKSVKLRQLLALVANQTVRQQHKFLSNNYVPNNGNIN